MKSYIFIFSFSLFVTGIQLISADDLTPEELGLDDFSEFLEDEATMAKIEALMNVRDNHDGTPNWHERAKSLAIFSAFTEGVNLFSSFAVLLSYKMRNLLKGVGQIVEWSVRDESLHSEAGCWLFRTLMKEHPEFKTKKLIKEIEEAAHLALQLEFDFIDKVFEMGDLENLTKDELKKYKEESMRLFEEKSESFIRNFKKEKH